MKASNRDMARTIDTQEAFHFNEITDGRFNIKRLSVQVNNAIKWGAEFQRASDLGLQIRSAKMDVARNQASVRTLEEIYITAGTWSRFFLVQNTGGHVHSSMGCSTCFATTEFSWLPELSGASEKEAVEEWGRMMCTTCFPTAPTDPNFNRPSRRDRESIAAKATEKAEKIAAKNSAACGKWKTDRAAKAAAGGEAYSLAFYNVACESYAEARGEKRMGLHPTSQEWSNTVREALNALATKNGRDFFEELVEAQVRLENKWKREGHHKPTTAHGTDFPGVPCPTLANLLM